jgi:hypothetical protein
MNTRTGMEKISHPPGTKLLVTTLCALILLCAFWPASGVNAQPPDRVVTKMRSIHLPVEVKLIKTRKKIVALGQNFSDSDDWFKGLTVSVENTSGKTIIYIGGGFLFPRPKEQDASAAPPPRYQDFMYGRHPAAPSQARLTAPPISVEPGETIDITLPESDYDRLVKRLKELRYPAVVREIKINFEEIYFSDGTAWIAGSPYERDPADPTKYNRVERDPPRAQAKRDAVSFPKTGFGWREESGVLAKRRFSERALYARLSA